MKEAKQMTGEGLPSDLSGTKPRKRVSLLKSCSTISDVEGRVSTLYLQKQGVFLFEGLV